MPWNQNVKALVLSSSIIGVVCFLFFFVIYKLSKLSTYYFYNLKNMKTF